MSRNVKQSHRSSTLESACYIWNHSVDNRRAVKVLFLQLVSCLLIATILSVSVKAQAKVELKVDASKTGAKIDRQIFGQFAEHLGHGVYEGIWVGPDSKIPNTRGIRNDVVAAF